MRTLIAFGPLLLSVLLIQLGVGVLGPLDPFFANQLDFSTTQIGLIGSAHFFGFGIGCVLAPALIARSGHSRAFAVAAALGVVGALMHPVFQDPLVWMLLRVTAGFAIAVGYTVIESWLQARLENENRARSLSYYRMIDLTGSVASQLLLIQLPPEIYVAYILVAVVGAISLLPLALTTIRPPDPPKRPRLRLAKAIRLSPLGAAGIFVTGLTNSSFRMVGPVYGVEFSMTRSEIAFFLAAAMLGGALAQPLVGWIADKFDRRNVLIGVSVAALSVCAMLAMGALDNSPTALILGSFLFGVAAMPLYSISSAYANDYCPKDFVVELNASLILLFAGGAVLSPYAAAALIESYGPNALWLYIAIAHVALIVFGLYRMTRRPAAEKQGAYRYMPRTSLILGRLVKASKQEAAENQKTPPDK